LNYKIKTGMLQRNYLYVASLLLAFAAAAPAFSQKPYVATGWTGIRNMSMDKAITDTLDDQFDSATVTVYASPNGGFVSGNSGYNEIGKAQEFDVNASYVVEGFLYWFAYKEQQSLDEDSSALTLTFWKMDSSASIGGVTRYVPRSVFASEKLPVQDLDTSVSFASGVNVWMVTPTLVYINYAVGFTMEDLNIKDTIALYTSSDEDPPIPTLSWEKWNGQWNTIYNNWGLDIDLAVFPLVDMTTAGLEDDYFVEHLKMNLYPNPSDDVLQLEYATEKTGQVDLVLFDQSGRAVHHESYGVQAGGTYRSSVDVSQLSPGIYYVSLGVDKYSRLTKKLVIR